MPPSCTKQIL